MTEPTMADVTALFTSGLDAVRTITGGFGADEWSRAACGRWDNADTVRHLLAVADWYHAWLDRALAGDSAPPFDPSEFDARNDAEVEARQALSGPDATQQFLDRATAYLERATPHWDTPFGFPLGTVTVGLHIGVGAAEWHLHAWDLTTGSARYVPQNAGTLFVVAGRAVAAATGGFRGRMVNIVVPLAAKRSPWTAMLKRSGRRG